MNPLLSELRAAFPPAPLDAAGMFRQYPDADLCERAVHNKTWDQLDPRLIATRDEALVFLSAERFIHWLPAYLHQLVLTPPAASLVWGALMTRLTRPEHAARKQRRFEELGDQLTPQQRRAVARSLQLAVERHPAWGERPQRALDGYWGAFSETSTVTQDPFRDELRAVFPPVVISDVFVEGDWQYCELFEYRRAVEGKTWEQIDPLFLVHHGEALAQLGAAVVRAVLPMHLHLLIVYAPTAATEHVITALDRDDLALSDAQRAVIARYRAAIS